jgi:hypothetical protein
MRREILFVTVLALTIFQPAFAPPQSLSSPLVPNSKVSQIDLKKLTKKADSGDTAAQFKLGYVYQFGLDEPRRSGETSMTMLLNCGEPRSLRLALRASLVILFSMILLHAIIFKMKTRMVWGWNFRELPKSGS